MTNRSTKTSAQLLPDAAEEQKTYTKVKSSFQNESIMNILSFTLDIERCTQPALVFTFSITLPAGKFVFGQTKLA